MVFTEKVKQKNDKRNRSRFRPHRNSGGLLRK